jgi:hypothetical protein
MAGILYTIGTAVGIIFVGAALALQVVYIQKYQDNDETYLYPQLASQVMNTLLVVFLVISSVYFRPSGDFTSIVLSSSLLLIGLGLEFAVDQMTLDVKSGGFVGAYFLAGINALFRLFFLIQIRCDTPLTSIPDLLKEVANVAKQTGKPLAEVQKQIAPPLQSIDFGRVNGQFENLLAKIADLTPEEKLEKRNKLRETFGLQPKGAPTGGWGGRR